MKYEVGQITEGKVTGIQPDGAFVLLNDNVTGLIHISEISDGYVRDITRYVREGDIVRVKVIDYDRNARQARLSLKALHPNTRSHRRNYTQKATMPENKLGFSSIAGMMDEWITEAKERKND